jgi:hypothetical protein
VRFRPLPLISAVLATSLLMTTTAAAQGRGRPKAPKATTQPATISTSAGTETTTSTVAPNAPTTFRQFGSWLDDASAPTPGEARTGIGIGYWRLQGASQFNAPMVDLGYGLTDRFQVSASVPFYHANFAGTTFRGLDDVYISAKYTALDPTLTESEFGLAVSPTIEVLSAGATDGRVHVGLPVSMELRRQPFRVYGSVGYFSRGSVFTGGAIEWATPSGMALTGAVIQSYSLNDDATLDTLGIGKQRVDVMGGIARPVGSMAAVYASVARTLTSIDDGGTIVSLSAGISFRFSAVRGTP